MKIKFDWLAGWRWRSGLRRIKRYIAWFPIIWRDEDWDEAYLFEIMRFKISRLRFDMTKANRHVCVEKNIKQMKVAEELLKRMGLSEYYWNLHEKNRLLEYADICQCPENTIAWEEHEGYGRLIDLRWDFCKNSFSRRLKQEVAKENADKKYLFNLLAKESHKWWN